MVKFYFMPESPPCRTVLMVAELCKLKLDKRYLNLSKGEHLEQDFTQENPLQKVPFIVDGDLRINESRAISSYLVSKYASDDSLYPKDLVKRAQVDELLYLDATLLYSSFSKLFHPRFFLGQKELDPENEKAVHKVLNYFENRLKHNGGKKFMLDNQLTIGYVSIATSFTLLEANEYQIDNYNHLREYLNNLKNCIPKYEEINREPIKNMKNYIKLKCSS